MEIKLTIIADVILAAAICLINLSMVGSVCFGLGSFGTFTLPLVIVSANGMLGARLAKTLKQKLQSITEMIQNIFQFAKFLLYPNSNITYSAFASSRVGIFIGSYKNDKSICSSFGI